jgi:hypothetical protein
MSYASAKGYRGEVAVLDYIGQYILDSYRPRAGTPHDIGDVVDRVMVHSVKNCRTMALSTWVDEMTGMVTHAGQETGVVWHHRKGKGQARDWYVTTTGALFIPLYLAYRRSWGARP